MLVLCRWLATTRVSVAIAESIWTFPLVESAHVLGVCLFIGFTLLFDLRLLGWRFHSVPLSEMSRKVMPWIVGGFVVMAITGALTFLNAPVRYYTNVFFRLKMVVILLAGINAWVFHRGIERRINEWDTSPVTPFAAKLAGGTSLLLWSVVIAFGRMIAYNWFDKVRT